MSCSASVTPLGFIKLEIPTPVPEPPAGAGWIHEIKYDGYRTLIVIDQGKVRAYSRPGRDWTGPYRRVVDACANLGCKAALIDGEVVVQDENGISDFDALRLSHPQGAASDRVLCLRSPASRWPGSAENPSHRAPGSAPEAD